MIKLCPPRTSLLALVLTASLAVGDAHAVDVSAHPSAPGAGEAPFEAGYDLGRDEGVLAALDPGGRPFVFHRRPGQHVVEQLALPVEGRQGWLLLWRGFPRGEAVFPEVWVLDPGHLIRRVWPPDSEFYWLDPVVARVPQDESGDETWIEVERHLAPPDLQGPPAVTRERLRVTPGGVDLVSKIFEPWGGVRQLVAVVEDLLVLGEGASVTEAIREHQRRVGPVPTRTARRLLGLVRDAARAAGADSRSLEEAGELLRREEER